MSHLRRQITAHRRSEQVRRRNQHSHGTGDHDPGQWLNSDWIRDQALRTSLAGVWVSTRPRTR
jgi:hypothetical protein